MRLTLVSNHRNLEVRKQARFSYHCDGKSRLPVKGLPNVPECSGRISKGEMYVALVEWLPQSGRAVPLSVKTDTGKYCAHCALALFHDIKVSEVHCDVDTGNQDPQMPLVCSAAPPIQQSIFRDVP